MEQNLLTNLLKDAFRNKWQRFISSASDNYPDAMFQIGNKLFIIECKDCLMDETTCESSDFETIKANIDRNFIRDEKNGKKKSKAKGISQLANYIEEYIKGNYCNYESVDLDKRFIFNSKLVIYPIIIFTDFHYKLSGLNHYLNLEFQKILLNKESICPQRIRNHIRPVTTISLDFLFMYKYKFQSGECRLSDMIDKYHKKSAYLYRTKKNKGVGALSQQYRSFDWENNRDLVPHGEGYNKDIAYICGRE